MFKICRVMSSYSNAHAKVKNLIFDFWFPGNRFGFGIILNDFWSSTIWAFEILISYAELKNPKKTENST